MLLSAGVGNIIGAANRFIERGTADSEALAYAYAQRSRFVNSTTEAWTAAARDYARAVQLSTQCKPFYLVRLAEIVAKRDWEGATSYFNQAITLSPRDPYVFFRRGILHREAQKNDLALRDFDEVIRLVPHRSSAYIQRAEIRRAEGDIDGALQDYHAAFDRADSQFIQITQWGLRDKRVYRGETDGSAENHVSHDMDTDRLRLGVRLGCQPRVFGDPSAIAQAQQEACIGVQSAEVAQPFDVLLGRNALEP